LRDSCKSSNGFVRFSRLGLHYSFEEPNINVFGVVFALGRNQFGGLPQLPFPQVVGNFLLR